MWSLRLGLGQREGPGQWISGEATPRPLGPTVLISFLSGE